MSYLGHLLPLKSVTLGIRQVKGMMMSNELLRSEKVMVRLTAADFRRLDQRAKRERRSLSSMVDVIVSDALQNEVQPMPLATAETKR